MKDQNVQLTDQICLRPASSEDREFLLRVYESSREIELAMVPWDDATKRAFVEHQFDAQADYYRSKYPDSRHYVIEKSGEGVGRLWVNRTEELISMLDVTVLSEHRRQGIGSAVIGPLIEEAQGDGKSVQVYVETFNPSQEYFAKRGFEIESNDGINLKLVRYAKS